MRSKKVLARGNGKCKGLEPSEPGIFKEEQESPCGWPREWLSGKEVEKRIRKGHLN